MHEYKKVSNHYKKNVGLFLFGKRKGNDEYKQDSGRGYFHKTPSLRISRSRGKMVGEV